MKIVSVSVIALFVVLAGCQSTGNAIGSVFNPVIGTWSSETLGAETEMVFNADDTTTETVTILGISTTKNGQWSSNDTSIYRTWEDGSVDTHYYSFTADTNKLTLSNSSKGVSKSYTRK